MQSFLKKSWWWLLFVLLISVLIWFPVYSPDAEERIQLDPDLTSTSLYPGIEMIKDREMTLQIEEVASAEFQKQFFTGEPVEQRPGFFDSVTWLRFELDNQSDQSEWLLEFAFPLIYELDIYQDRDSGYEVIAETGAVGFPFDDREMNHRHFVFELDIAPGESETFFVRAKGSGDLHPPINLWHPDSFMERTQVELIILGIFYGVVSGMIVYNLFLYVSLKIKSYLYYVLAMTCTLMGKLSINGIGFQYLWPDYPGWNQISTPFWVGLGSIFILMFTRSFLDADEHTPGFRKVSYGLIGWNTAVIVMLFISTTAALTMMIAGALATFVAVLTVAFQCFRKGVRQARFFLLGWMIFLTGVAITMLERAVVIPFSLFADYAGQGAMTIEVVVLSFALADKISLIRKEKEEAEAQARESQEMAMENLKQADILKNEFLAVTSHELRTPLFGMIGMAESLRDGAAGEPTENMKEQLETIVASGNRLAHLVNDILDFSKLKYDSLDLAVKPVEVKGVMDIVVTVTRPLLKNKPVALTTAIPADLPMVYADPNRLQQILYNLVGNAIKYTDEGEIVLSASQRGEVVMISVTDTGRGMKQEEVDYIFDPFYQAETEFGAQMSGTGIGLSVTKKLVDLHKGTLFAETIPGEGSTFTFSLPVHEQQQETDDLLQTQPALKEGYAEKKVFVHRSGKSRILVADDEAVNLQVLTNQLSLEGYDVLIASTGQEVLDILDEQKVDLIIMDLMMPGLSGYEVCGEIRKTYSLIDLPVLMLTAKSGLSDKVVSFEAGANDYLVKPCDKLELISRVRTLIRIRSMNEELKSLNELLEKKVEERTEALKDVNEDLLQANEDLMDAQEMRKQLLSSIAHELGTPVAIIHSYMQSLQAGLIALDDTYYHEQVAKKIQVLNRLINDLYDLSKLEKGQAAMEKDDHVLYDWLSQVEETCRFEVEQHDRLFTGLQWVFLEKEAKSWCCHVDVNRMDQVFSNLVRNSAKYTSEEDGEIGIHALIDHEEKTVVVAVKDNGSGIDEHDVPHMFERFYRGKDSHGSHPDGSGLGLAIVKQVVENHDGDVRVESQLGEGAVFFVKLPLRRIEKTET
ncbi:ATP-binding protein [Salisediminibacterium beveridgei]|uniref:Circadian input-output histidine kinase CikA n=1 Tax=Salisediminibacterium beveridgei TaxID=632773 RepID=A0A1D7QS06_9BACI|nr:ATP-binding protein [Salisediminibacterium beveridgei]AOM81763.1 adenylate/guanylate cyclase [Salisediminibacterium beveridgei]